MPEGRAANHACCVTTLSPPIGASLPGALVSVARMVSPASTVTGTSSGERVFSFAFCSAVAGASMRAYAGSPCRATRSRYRSDGDWPVTAMISAASRHSSSPSLSVDHGLPSNCTKDAPADSSPPNTPVPVSRPGTNHLKPTGTSTSSRPRSPATRSIIEELTRVLPTPALWGHCSRWRYR